MTLIGTTTVAEVVQAETYAALAVVPQHGRVHHGYAKRDSIKAARAAALKKCGHARCIVAQGYRVPQCVHLVLGDGQIFWNNERFGRNERARIMDACRRVDENCSVIVSECLK
jgi:hypothetical protein